MISHNDFFAYNMAVAKISDSAASSVESDILSWIREHPGASVAECREAAKGIMDGLVQTYDDAAATLAAKWYDRQAEAANVKLPVAITCSVYSPKRVDETARYQAKKLANGDVEGFAKYCGELARNDALRSLNETIMANAGRDRKKGVRFARVTTGATTCSFCLMLASRGAVYRSRKTAGEFKHFHRRCDCKVVPGFESDPMAELVEGHNPKDELRRWERIKSARAGKRQIVAPDVDFASGLSEAKKLWLDHGSAESYRSSVGAYIRSLNQANPITTEDYVTPLAKELEAAYLLSQTGSFVHLRNSDVHYESDGNTSDVLADGVTCDFKKIESPSIKKMRRRVTEKIPRQGPCFLVDISESEIPFWRAEAAAAKLLDDPAIERIYLMDGKSIEVLDK